MPRVIEKLQQYTHMLSGKESSSTQGKEQTILEFVLGVQDSWSQMGPICLFRKGKSGQKHMRDVGIS